MGGFKYNSLVIELITFGEYVDGIIDFLINLLLMANLLKETA